MTWVRGAAIRPVPAYAVVPESVLDRVERELAGDGAPAGGGEEQTRSELDRAFHRFEETQPNLASKMGDVLEKPIDETALALGYFLSIAIWLAFERSFTLELVTEDAVRATEAALTLEEELRASHSDEPLELDDVVAMEQPGVLSFVNEHVEAALDPRRERGAAGTGGMELEEDEEGAPREVDVEDVHLVYRAILILTLALSHAVVPEGGPQKTDELLA